MHRRDAAKMAASGKEAIGEDDFFILMECLGLAAWIGGGRTGTEEDFRRIRDDSYAQEYRDRFETLNSATLRNVAVQFYTHSGNQDQHGYAFIHKNFGEYLAARAIIAASVKWCGDYAPRKRWDQFAQDWLFLTGGRHISPDMLNFMIDEARLRMKWQSLDELDWSMARRLVGQLNEVASLTIQNGFPAHGQIPGVRGRHWRLRETWQRNAEEALYAIMHVWAEVGYPLDRLSKPEVEGGWTPGPIKVVWPSNRMRPAKAMINRLRDPWGVGVLHRKNFARWDFSQQFFEVFDLVGFNLGGADLQKASLQQSNLMSANLYACNLTEADLISANLSGAKLNKADLTRAGLHRTQLIAAILVGADLAFANLSLANLQEADLAFANLSLANLQGADLRNATLTLANLAGANLDSALNVTQEQIVSALGDEATKLPEGLKHPAHWTS